MDLLKISDFNCGGDWDSYDNVEENIFVGTNEYAVVNYLARTETEDYFIYNRIFLRADIELLEPGISAVDFLDKLTDPYASAFAMQSDIDCSGVDIG